MELQSVLTKYFCDTHNINLNTNYKIEWIKAKELIVPERIDLIAKIKYIENRDRGLSSSFINEMYDRHIEAFTLGTYTEAGNSLKNSIDRYRKVFDQLIDRIKREGFDEKVSVVPVGRNNVILDGAHRTAIAAYYNLDIPIIRFDGITANYDSKNFQHRLLDESYLDYMVTEYCKLKDNVYIAICWPRIKGHINVAESIMEMESKIVYRKRLYLNYNGLRNLIIQAYGSHSWIGTYRDKYAGAISQVEGCFDKEGILHAYVLECEQFEELVKMKKKIRQLYGVGNFSIHSSDNQDETVQLANILFNNNSIRFLNYGNPDYDVNLNVKIDILKERLKENHFSFNNILVDASSVLGLYGLREVEDLDFITIDEGFEVLEDNEISNHNDYIEFYGITKEELVLNPNHFFFYNDLKFVTLEVLRKFKRNRNEKKDRLDIKLIDSVLNNQLYWKLATHKLRSILYRKQRNFNYRIRIVLVMLLTKLGLYNSAKKLYIKWKIIRGKK